MNEFITSEAIVLEFVGVGFGRLVPLSTDVKSITVHRCVQLHYLFIENERNLHIQLS